MKSRNRRYNSDIYRLTAELHSSSQLEKVTQALLRSAIEITEAKESSLVLLVQDKKSLLSLSHSSSAKL